MKKGITLGVRLGCLACCAAMLFAFTSCGGGTTTSGGGTASGGTTTSGGATNSDGTPVERVKKDGVYLTGFPIVDEKVDLTLATFSISLHGDFETMPMNTYYEDMTNVHITWDVIPSSDSQAVNSKILLAFQSGDMPDIMCYPGYITNDMMQMYGELCVTKVSDYWEYAPNIDAYYKAHPEVIACVANEDGSVYGLPHYEETDPGTAFGNKMWINQRWLDNLGLDMPTTTEELRQVLVAFKNNDPNMNGSKDEIPMSSVTADNAILGAFGLTVQGQNGVTVDNDGNLVYVATSNSIRQMYAYYSSLYTEGLLDADFWAHSRDDYNEKIRSDVVGVWFGGHDFTILGKDNTDYTIVPPLEGPEGDKMWYYRSSMSDISPNWFIMTATNEHPQVSMRWMDYFYTNAGRLLGEFGPPGEDLMYVIDGDIEEGGTGTWHFNDYEENGNLPDGLESGEQWRYKLTTGYVIPSLSRKSLDSHDVTPEDEEDRLTWIQNFEQTELLPYAPKYQFPSLTLNAEDQAIITMYATDLSNYNDENAYLFAHGEKSIDSEWDSFVEEMNKRGAKEVLEVMQRNYDVYLAKMEAVS